jgi:hypothetical protein
MKVRIFTLSLCILILFSQSITLGQSWPWASSLGDTTGHTSVYAMGKYTGSHVLLAGSFSSKNLKVGSQTISGKGNNDVLLAAVDSTGQFQWGIGFGGTSDERATALATDHEGNIYLAGNYSSLTIDFGTTTLVNKGESDGFLVKINSQKQVEWAMSFGGSARDEVSGLATDQQGNVYITGSTADYAKNQFSIFTLKIDGAKNNNWQSNDTKKGTSTQSTSLVLDDSGNCYVAGGFSDVLIFDGKQSISSPKAGEAPFEYYEESAFVAKYSSSGNFVKAIAHKGFSKVNDICAASNNLYLCGEKVNYGIGWGWPLMDTKIFTARFNTNLDLVWEKSTGGATPFQSMDRANAITADNQGNVYLTGSFFSDKLSFANQQLSNIQNKDYFYEQVFVLKYDHQGNEVWGNSVGSPLCDAGNAILALDNERILIAGTFESNPINFGQHSLRNNSEVREVYVHLRPKRQSRNQFSFVAMHHGGGSGNKPIGNNRFVVYPNPVGDSFTIALSNDTLFGGNVSVFAKDGRLVGSISVPAGEKKVQMNTIGLQKGIYLVKINIDGDVSIQKMVKK